MVLEGGGVLVGSDNGRLNQLGSRDWLFGEHQQHDPQPLRDQRQQHVQAKRQRHVEIINTCAEGLAEVRPVAGDVFAVVQKLGDRLADQVSLVTSRSSLSSNCWSQARIAGVMATLQRTVLVADMENLAVMLASSLSQTGVRCGGLRALRDKRAERGGRILGIRTTGTISCYTASSLCTLRLLWRRNNP